MKKSSRRTLSRLLAGVMLFSSVFSTTFVNASDLPLAAYADEATSGGAGDVVTSGGAVAGQTYSVDFAAIDPGDKSTVDGLTFADGTVSVSSAKGYYHGSGHGLALYDSDKIDVQVAGNADVTFTLCQYGNGTTFTVTNAKGEELGTIAAKGAADGEEATFNYTGEATTLTFTLASAGEAYLHGIKSVNAAAPVGEAESFELWLDDIATDVTNADGTVSKTVAAGDYKYKDSTLTLVKGLNGEDYTIANDSFTNLERKDRIVSAYKAGNRPTECNAFTKVPDAGSCVIFTPAATGMMVCYFQSGSFLRVSDFEDPTTTPVGTEESEAGAPFYAFKAQAGHTYVMSTTGKTNNCAYAGFEYVVDEPTTVAFSTNNINANPDSIPSLKISLIDSALGKEEAVIGADATEVKLAKGHTYKLATNDGGVKATVAGKETFVATGDAVVIDLEDIPDQTLTGTITGTPEGTVTAISFTNMVNGAKYDATITGSTYSCVMKPGDYNTSIVSTNGGVTYDRVKVEQIADGAENTNVNEVYVELPSLVGKFAPDAIVANLTCSATVASRGNDLTGKPGDTIIIPVSSPSKVTVESYYQATFDVDGTACVSDSGSTSQIDTFTFDATKDMTLTFGGTGTSYLISISIDPVVEFKSEINVPGDYATLTEAVSAIKGMPRPEGEAGRVTINLTADIQEQVVVDAPYVGIKGNGHTINWYYGVGTFYYSIDEKTGLYSERLYRDRYSSAEGNGSLWGGTVIVKADYFYAEDVTFLNTYNYYVTDKEIPDFAKTTTAAAAQRTSKDVDVQTQAAKERSNALYVDGDHLECYNCKILSSQDTLGANKATNFYSYFKNCVIGGNTDFICGAGNMVFDNCELQWKSVTEDDKGNNQKLIGPTPRDGQYVFRNCVWTADTTKNGPVMGKFGRTWQDNSHSAFINTETNGLIDPAGWGEMSKGQLATAQFIEDGNTVNGEPMDITEMGNSTYDAAGVPTKMSDEEVAALVANFKDEAYTINTVLGGWKPVHYSYKEAFKGIWGDIDKSGDLTANDASLALSRALNASLESDTRFDFGGADVDADGDITAADAAMILQKVLDAEFKFPAAPEEVETTTEAPLDEGNEYIPVNEGGARGMTVPVDTLVFNTADGSVVAAQPLKIQTNGDAADPELEAAFGKAYADLIKTSSNNTQVVLDDAKNETGGPLVKSYRLGFKITAKYDTTVEVDCKVNAGKAAYFATTDGEVAGTTATGDPYYNYTSISGLNNTAADAVNTFTTLKADLKAGETVYFMGQGTDVPVYAVRFVAAPQVYVPVNEGGSRGTTVPVETVILDGANGSVVAAQPLKIQTNGDAADPELEAAFGQAYADLIKTSSNNTQVVLDDAKNETGGPLVKSYRLAFAITAKQDTVVSVDCKVNAGKAAYFATTDGEVAGTTATGDPYYNYTSLGGLNNTAADAVNTFTTLSVPVKAGETVYFMGQGTDVPVYAVRLGEGSKEPSTEVTSEESTETTTVGEPVNVFVVGDSTGCHYADTEDTNYYYKRVGFGDKIADYVTSNVTVTNLALSGRSSKSFLAEANYETLKNSIAKGDILIIAFGHNDEKSDDAARYTFPSTDANPTTKDTEGSFKNSLYVNYVKLAQDAGATPIICSPIVRRTDSGSWSANNLHKANNGDYAADAKALAEEVQVPFIDLTALTQAKYDALTPANSVNLHAWTSSKSTSVDNTHLNNYGAKEVAWLIATNAPEVLAANIVANPAEPTTKDLVVNPAYVEAPADDLTGEALVSKLWKTTAPWYGTVFGDIGGQGKLNAQNDDGSFSETELADANGDGTPNYLISEDGSSVRMVAGEVNADDTQGTGYGKIAGTSDGLAMYYQPVDAKMNFSISAKAHVNNVAKNNNQTAFGLIVADRVEVDKNNKQMIPYVAAAPLKMSPTVGSNDPTTGNLITAWAGYARINDTLTNAGTTLDSQEALPKSGDVIDLKITKLGNKYTVEYNGQVSTYEMEMTDQVYVGTFVARCADVTFTDIVFNNEVTE